MSLTFTSEIKGKTCIKKQWTAISGRRLVISKDKRVNNKKASENFMSPLTREAAIAFICEARSRNSIASREVFSAARARSNEFFIVQSLS